jgi:hypothetical protein
MRRRLAVLLGCLAALLVVALPATANQKPTTGTRIALGNPPATFPANTPFHIEHGFTCELADANCMAEQISDRGDFDLFLDGVLQRSTVDVDVIDGSIRKLRLTNYPSGLPGGTYTFVGRNLIDGNVVLTRIATITFT